jgi:hypothetical protein
MTINGTRQDSYNKFTGVSQVPYSLISHMMTNDIIWKLLHYDDADAWKTSKANLTTSQKGLLVYDGVKKINECKVFLDTGADDAWLNESTMLRISVIEGIPNNYVWGSISIAFEVYAHYKVNTLSNYAPRHLSICENLIDVFNGADIAGVGRVYFDAKASSRAKMYVMGAIPYKGMCVIMNSHELG